MLVERQFSQSPSRRLSLTEKISAFGAKLTRSLSASEDDDTFCDTESRDSVPSELPRLTDRQRSASRGREALQSTGRGGFGNIRQQSTSLDARPDTGPDDFSNSRGREPLNPNKVYSTGRGGAGNLRSPSREVTKVPSTATIEEEVIKSYVMNKQDMPFSTGRGGMGNISGSSRSRSRGPAAYSTGRGGAGNIVASDGNGIEPEIIDEEERRKLGSPKFEAYHSTGRGGAANIITGPTPDVEHHPHNNPGFESTGRGGAGNIVIGRSRSRS